MSSPANPERYERLRRLSPVEAIEAWLAFEFGIGDEPAMLEAIRKESRVRLNDVEISDVISFAMDDGDDAVTCLAQLIYLSQL